MSNHNYSDDLKDFIESLEESFKIDNGTATEKLISLLDDICLVGDLYSYSEVESYVRDKVYRFII